MDAFRPKRNCRNASASAGTRSARRSSCWPSRACWAGGARPAPSSSPTVRWRPTSTACATSGGLLDFAQNTRLAIRHEGFASIADGTVGGFTELLGKRWLRIAGVRSTRVDGKPLCWSEVLIPEPFAPDRAAIHRGSEAIYEVVMAHNNLRLDYVEQEVSATDLPRQHADLLHAEAESAALMVSRRYVAHTGATFEISLNLYPASRYSVRSVIRQRV